MQRTPKSLDLAAIRQAVTDFGSGSPRAQCVNFNRFIVLG